MKHLLSFVACMTLLTGCFGESYDFSPPTVTLTDADNLGNEAVLAEGNIDWHSDRTYDQTVLDTTALADEQRPLYVKAGQVIDYALEDGFFDRDGVTITVIEHDIVEELALTGVEAFLAPERVGEYILVFDLATTKGDAQYVGKLVVQQQ